MGWLDKPLGNTLDLVVTPAQCQLDGDITVDLSGLRND